MIPYYFRYCPKVNFYQYQEVKMSLKSEVSQLRSRYPVLTTIVITIICLCLLGAFYEFSKTIGRDIYLLIH